MDKCDRKKDNQGFSLTELLIMVAILGIMAGFSIPVVTSSMQDMQLISDARNIATTATYAKLSASAQMTRYRLSFDLTTNQWSVSKLNRATGNYETQGPTNKLGNNVGSNTIGFKATASSAPSGFNASSSSAITFNSRGIPIEGPSAIYISNQNAEYAITVSLAGKVQFMRYKNSQWTNQ